MEKRLREGQVFAFPLGSQGHFGVCRVVRLHQGEAVLAALDWFGSTRPSLEMVSDRPLVYDNHGPFGGEAAIYWGAKEPPPDFECIGSSEPSREEIDLTTCRCEGRVCLCKRRQGGWKACRASLYRYWRWQEDQAGYEAEREQMRQELARVREETEAMQQVEKKRMTLEQFRDTKLFEGWEGYRAPKIIEASRRVFRETAERLMGFERWEGDEAAEVMRWCIEQFNELDSEHHFIETLEREEICEAFEQLAELVGLEENLADRWREW